MKRRASLSRACKRGCAEPAAEQEIGLLDLPNEILVMILRLSSVPLDYMAPEWATDAIRQVATYRNAITLAGTCHRFQDLFVNYTCAAMSLPPAQMAEDFFICNGVCVKSGLSWAPIQRQHTTRAQLCQSALWELRFIRTLRAANANVAVLPPRVKIEQFDDMYCSTAIIFRDSKRPALAVVWPIGMANAYAQTHYSDRNPPVELEPRMSAEFMENCRARHQASN